MIFQGTLGASDVCLDSRDVNKGYNGGSPNYMKKYENVGLMGFIADLW